MKVQDASLPAVASAKAGCKVQGARQHISLCLKVRDSQQFLIGYAADKFTNNTIEEERPKKMSRSARVKELRNLKGEVILCLF